MDLAVIIDGHDADHGSCLAVASQKHGPGTDTARCDRIREDQPAEAVVVLGGQVGR